MPELTLSPQSGTMNSTTECTHLQKEHQLMEAEGWGKVCNCVCVILMLVLLCVHDKSCESKTQPNVKMGSPIHSKPVLHCLFEQAYL
jgi:hypothetical protein